MGGISALKYFRHTGCIHLATAISTKFLQVASEMFAIPCCSGKKLENEGKAL